MLMVMRWNSLERSAVDVEGVTLMIIGGVVADTAGEEEPSAEDVSMVFVDIGRFEKKLPKRKKKKKNIEQKRLR